MDCRPLTVHKGTRRRGSAEILDAVARKWQRRGHGRYEINATAAALLGLLHEGPMTGGQLMAAAERRLGPYWSMTRSQVYRELPALAEHGFRPARQARPPGQPAVLDHAAGKRAFARWLAEEPGAESPAQPGRAAGRVRRAARSDTQLKDLYSQATEYHNDGAGRRSREQAKAGEEGRRRRTAPRALEFAIGYHKAALAWLKAAPAKIRTRLRVGSQSAVYGAMRRSCDARRRSPGRSG